MENENINNGCILLARRILLSEIWKKPPEYLKIWIYILLKVNHQDKLFPRGSNFFNWSEEIKDISGVTKNQIYEFLRWAKSKKVDLITAEKTTRGMIIKVNNYDTYQTLENYKPKKTKPPKGDEEEKEEVKRFKPPTLEEVEAYCKERNNNVDAKVFFEYYNEGKWKDGNGKPLKNWKQKIIAVWENKNQRRQQKNKVVPITNNKQNNDAFYMTLSR